MQFVDWMATATLAVLGITVLLHYISENKQDEYHPTHWDGAVFIGMAASLVIFVLFAVAFVVSLFTTGSVGDYPAVTLLVLHGGLATLFQEMLHDHTNTPMGVAGGVLCLIAIPFLLLGILSYWGVLLVGIVFWITDMPGTQDEQRARLSKSVPNCHTPLVG